MYYLFLFVSFIFIFLSLLWIVKIVISNYWIYREKEFGNTSSTSKVRFFVLIPVLDESRILEGTIEYFYNVLLPFKSSFIYIITTEREYEINEKNGVNDTLNLAQILQKKYSNVISLHYPEKNGKMAHQLNYAVEHISKNLKLYNRDYFSVYNADSRPDANTFNWISNYLANKKYKGQPKIFQQYGNYLGNVDNFTKKGNYFLESMLYSAALWQNRWSLGFELPHALFQFIPGIKNILKYFPILNYCIGHGLFFSYSYYKESGKFTENMYNEDALFGLKACVYGHKIIPIPVYDKSSSPDSIKGLFFQKASWYFGPLQSFEYYREIINERNHIKKWRLLTLTIKLFFHAIYWFFGPFFIMLNIIYAIYVNSALVWMYVVGTVLLFLVVPSFVAWLMLNSGRNTVKNFSVLLRLCIGSVPFYMLHGMSTIPSIYKYFMYLLFNKSMKKEKTLMIYGRII